MSIRSRTTMTSVHTGMPLPQKCSLFASGAAPDVGADALEKAYAPLIAAEQGPVGI